MLNICKGKNKGNYLLDVEFRQLIEIKLTAVFQRL